MILSQIGPLASVSAGLDSRNYPGGAGWLFQAGSGPAKPARSLSESTEVGRNIGWSAGLLPALILDQAPLVI